MFRTPRKDSSPGSGTRIVVAGGGFGGAYVVRHPERNCRRRPDVEVVLVSRDNFLLMTPLLFEACSGTCILPGPVLFQPDLPHEERRQAIQATLTQRQGRPENIAQAVLFLVSEDFVTGSCLPVDGGRTVYAAGN